MIVSMPTLVFDRARCMRSVANFGPPEIWGMMRVGVTCFALSVPCGMAHVTLWAGGGPMVWDLSQQGSAFRHSHFSFHCKGNDI